MAANALRMLWGPGILHTSGGLGTSDVFALDSATDEIAIVFQVDRAGVLDTVQFFVTVQNGAARTWDVRFEGVDANGDPDGVAYGGMVAGVLSPAGVGHETVNMGTGATVSKGDLLCLRVVPTSVPDGGNNITVELTDRNYSGTDTYIFPFVTQSVNSGTTWTAQNGAPGIGIQYADGDWLFADLGASPSGLSTTTAYDSADAPNEFGARFQVPYLMECYGVRFAQRANTLIHPTVHLYNAASVEQRSVQYWSRTAQSRTVVALWEPFDLTALVNYFIGVTNPSGVTTINEPYYYELQEAAARSAYPFGDGLRWAHASRTGAGAWTITTTKLPMMSLLVSGVG